MNSWLNLNGKIFTISELSGIDSEIGKTEFEKTTLAFCKQWLSGEQSFRLNTSGSTGTAKEIQISRSQMEVSARLTIDALGLDQGMTSLVCLDTKYIAGKMMLVRSLIHGMNIIAVEPDSSPFKKINQKIDFAALVPYQIEKILDESKEQLNHLQCAVVGGATVSIALKEKMKSTSCRLYATYGMTETISHIALQKLNGADAQDFFQTQPGVKINLDRRGCLTIQADYLGKEPIVTNDFVEIISPSAFRWLGRVDNIINTGGIKVSPEKIESVFEKLFYEKNIVQRFFISSIAHALLGERVVLVVEGESFSEGDHEAILKDASALLGKYEIPKRIFFVKKFIETPTGKVNRKETMRLVTQD